MVDTAFLKDLAVREWTYVENASLHAVDGLNCPPFGQGYQRRIVDQIVGSSGLGVPFQAVRYSSDVQAATPGFSRTVTLRLSHPMPPLFVSLPDHPRPGIEGLKIPNQVGLLVVSPDPDFADAVLEVAQPALVRWAKRYPINLSIDGDSLTSIGAPVAADQLDAYVEALDDIAAALSSAPSLKRFTATKPAGLSFYQHPSWQYRERDDRMLVGASLAQGTNHRATDVVDIPERGLWFTSFIHRYETHSYDGNGHYTTTYHAEPLARMLLPFRFGVFANRSRGYGDPLMFFGAELESYAFSSPDPAFATAILEELRPFFAATRLPPFAIAYDQVTLRPATSDIREIGRLAWCFAELFSLIPDSIWHGLGLERCPVPRSLR